MYFLQDFDENCIKYKNNEKHLKGIQTTSNSSMSKWQS